MEPDATPQGGAPQPALTHRPIPLLPGTGLPRWFGLLLTLSAILVLEVILQTGLPLPVHAGLLLFIVATATYLEGARRGLVAATAAVGYEIYAYVQHGTALPDPSRPLLRAVSLVVATFVVVGMVAIFRRRLDRLLSNERELLRNKQELLERAEQDRRELSGALERVRCAQEALRLQASLLSAVGQGIIATDEFGRITYWNEPAERLFGRTVAQAATRSVTEVIPDPPSATESTLQRIARCARWVGDIEVTSVDGERITVLVSDSPIRDDAGRCAGMVRVATDVTAQKEVEAAQRLLAESGAAMAASLDYEATIRTVARLCVPAFADGCAVNVVEADGSAWRIEAAHADPAVEEKVRGTGRRYPLRLNSDDPVAAVIRTGLPIIATSVTEAELAGFAEDPEHLESLRGIDLGSVIVVPLRATGLTLGAMAFWRGKATRPFRDTDVRLAEEVATRAATAIQQARLFETALIASKAKSDFLAVMSHELRTPLTTIVGYTDLMLGGVPEPLPAKARTYIERVRIAAAHLLGLIEQILVFARLEAGREDTRPERIHLSQFLRDSATLIEPVAQEKGIGFALDLPPAEVTIETDSTKLRQILLNLLSNAVKFTEIGHVRLEAGIHGDTVTIAVSDTGIGIAAADIERVFDPFWQVDQSPTRRAGGAGLGLAVTRRLAEYLGGDIRVQSEEGRGTAFAVTLPVRWPPSRGVKSGGTGEGTGDHDGAGDPAALPDRAVDPAPGRY